MHTMGRGSKRTCSLESTNVFTFLLSFGQDSLDKCGVLLVLVVGT